MFNELRDFENRIASATILLCKPINLFIRVSIPRYLAGVMVLTARDNLKLWGSVIFSLGIQPLMRQ